VKIALAALSMAGLAGCGLWQQERFIPEKPVANEACGAIATDRASDAKSQGEDDRTQRSVFQRTYSDCTAWRLAHAD
jgi:hypothetical protein